ncbi:3-keto-5-aminohexanoate cleavage protein [uncultured Dysosmobacter sp.]|uniref:3-keto-5-aminohexanoate cleavage protein n=1 Tax=uncultured Dysosmobacter sp. TaxID=2591384 RepID=UPI00260800FE|nr:3-keto-5-aminohexanoate cleavage protein [uncultured Dysosmobacter sp.]
MSKQKKVIISAAITGAIHTPSLSPYLPASPEQIAQQAIDAAKAGAAVVHIHARRDDGMPVGDFDTFRQILSAIKKEVNAVIGITTGGAQGMSTEERFSVIEEFQPEMASANGGSMNFCFHKLEKGMGPTPKYDWEVPFVARTYDNVFKNTFKDIEYCIKTMNKCGTLPEYEVFDYGQLANLQYFQREGIITQPIYIQFVPGVMGGYPMSNEGMMFMIDQAKKMLGDDIQYSTVSAGRRMFRNATMMALQGGNVRVGMEDGLYIKPSGELATSNAQQVLKMKAILNALDFEIATPDEAREMLHLKGGDKVNF